MIISVPQSFDRYHMYSLLDQIITKDGNPIDAEIILDLSKLNFIEPVGVTILANLIEWLNKIEAICKLGYVKYGNESIKYLDDSLFFQRYLGHKLDDKSCVRPTTIPLQNVTYQSSYQWVENNFIHWLSGRLYYTPKSLSIIKTCMGEIFNNIQDHSTENIGCVFAQHYPRSNEVKIAISDFGVGIPYNVKKLKPCLTDSEAIEEATQNGFTTRSSPGNSGAGLSVLIQNVVQNNHGAVYIHSNCGILNCININGQVVKFPQENSSFYPGTLLEIILDTNVMNNILDFEEEFEW